MENIDEKDIAAKKEAFLKVFDKTPFPHLACEIAKITHEDLIQWLIGDKDFNNKVEFRRKCLLENIVAQLINSVLKDHDDGAIRTLLNELRYTESAVFRTLVTPLVYS